jgi:arylsulfatase
MNRRLKALGFAVGMACVAGVPAQTAPDRTSLPIREPDIPRTSIIDVRDAKAPARFQIKAPERAPNIVIILVDDMGFGQSSAFGGPIKMATLDRLAKDGIRYNQFHTTAVCSATRAAMLTGRNHHTVNAGSIMESATAFPGNTGQRPDSVAPLAKVLRYNGYTTGQFGKNHETPVWEVSASGPTDRWPTRNGFDKFYGFMGGETNQWAPAIYDGMSRVEVPRDPTYHFMTDMTDQAIKWVRSVQSLAPDKPFFLYFAPGATHAPHHVPKAWIAKYKGMFDQGWDKLREETLARQIRLGVVPPGTRLAPKPEAIKDWDKLTSEEKKLFARQMEVFAGFAEYMDTEIGRVVKAIGDMGQLENTLIFYVVGDNGASAEGGMNGLFNEISYFNGASESVQDVMKHYDELGGPSSYNHYAAGWAVAGGTPFAWTKQVASSYGGTRNGMVVHWPKAIKTKGEIRSQWHHVVDVTPTILEAVGLPQPKTVDGVPQTPIEGVSMVYSFNDANAKDTRVTQYFEIFGNRAIYHDGWLAGTVHKAPWEPKPRAALDADTWELYETTKDFSLANDLSRQNPAKLDEMKALFLKEAERHRVLPIDDRGVERMNAEMAGRPDVMAGRTSLTVYEGMVGMSENVFINIKNRSHTITADVVVPEGGARGVILSQAGRFGGWSLYFRDGKPIYAYNFLGRQRFTVAATEAVPAGKATIRFEFAYEGGGLGKGGVGTIIVNERKVAEGRVERTHPIMFSADEGVDVGEDGETPVVEDYGVSAPYKFTGAIHRVTVEVAAMKATERAEERKALPVAARETALTQ